MHLLVNLFYWYIGREFKSVVENYSRGAGISKKEAAELILPALIDAFKKRMLKEIEA